ncbi:hypothetical protein Pmani_013295 [Petrolisthes manimaculis]|uniref:Cadherin domain-containing protein n=1 Tax=Petrolisthes manimaculis TaxID=1843537 RepID=A0AAE1PVA9_9EUCA|nr:hypothetical protein Pmani_013295 [Petrolisthes manimaculis]
MVIGGKGEERRERIKGRKALDRDPPTGKGVWTLKVEVRDGQGGGRERRPTHHYNHRQRYPRHAAPWGVTQPEGDEINNERKEGERGREGNEEESRRNSRMSGIGNGRNGEGRSDVKKRIGNGRNGKGNGKKCVKKGMGSGGNGEEGNKRIGGDLQEGSKGKHNADEVGGGKRRHREGKYTQDSSRRRYGRGEDGERSGEREVKREEVLVSEKLKIEGRHGGGGKEVVSLYSEGSSVLGEEAASREIENSRKNKGKLEKTGREAKSQRGKRSEILQTGGKEIGRSREDIVGNNQGSARREESQRVIRNKSVARGEVYTENSRNRKKGVNDLGEKGRQKSQYRHGNGAGGNMRVKRIKMMEESRIRRLRRKVVGKMVAKGLHRYTANTEDGTESTSYRRELMDHNIRSPTDDHKGTPNLPSPYGYFPRRINDGLAPVGFYRDQQNKLRGEPNNPKPLSQTPLELEDRLLLLLPRTSGKSVSEVDDHLTLPSSQTRHLHYTRVASNVRNTRHHGDSSSVYSSNIDLPSMHGISDSDIILHLHVPGPPGDIAKESVDGDDDHVKDVRAFPVRSDCKGHMNEKPISIYRRTQTSATGRDKKFLKYFPRAASPDRVDHHLLNSGKNNDNDVRLIPKFIVRESPDYMFQETLKSDITSDSRNLSNQFQNHPTRTSTRLTTTFSLPGATVSQRRGEVRPSTWRRKRDTESFQPDYDIHNYMYFSDTDNNEEVCEQYDLSYWDMQAEKVTAAEVVEDDAGTLGRRRVHVVETMVTVLVKDINDNSPYFPNTTMYGKVVENSPAGEY